MTEAHQEPRSRLGVLGAGRLGAAIARRWRSIDLREALVWSRRFEAGSAGGGDDGGDDGATSTRCAGSAGGGDSGAAAPPFEIASIASVMSADTVVAAIPCSALAALAARHRSIARFAGALLVTGIDLSLDAMRRLTPAALVVRVVPALLSAPRSISCLVLDRGHAGPRWERAQAVLDRLGPVHRVEDEQAFEAIMYLTSPFPVVLRRALAHAVAAVLARGGLDPSWRPIAERVLWGGLASLTSDPLEGEIATPGGVTAAGLREAPALSRALQEALQIMMDHGALLRARQEPAPEPARSPAPAPAPAPAPPPPPARTISRR